jgi:uncharacterized membrane protein YdbT with pleckstrin-like domain
MTYPRKLLSANEVVKVDLKPHALYFLGPAFAVVGALILSILIVAVWDVSALSWFATIAIVVAACWLVGRFVRWRSTYFVVTDDKVIYRSGVFRKVATQIPLERVNSVNFEQNLIERLVGAGDLTIESGGMGGPATFTDVRHPDKVQVVIHDAIEENAAGLNRSAAEIPRRPVSAPPMPSSPLPPPPPTDVTGQLEKLEGLLQRGSITKEEFEAQKQKLLGL